MKKTNIYVKILSVFMLITVCISTTMPAFAVELPEIPNGTVVQADTEADIARADAQPVVADKGAGITPYAVSGSYPTRNGVILVTPDNGSVALVGHAAIIYNGSCVVESNPSTGVATGPNNWDSTKKRCYGVTVKSTTAAQDQAAANWCYARIGCSYNFNFYNVNTRSSFYCSQLVWAAYLDLYGINLDTSDWGNAIKPMELVNTDKTMTVYSKT